MLQLLMSNEARECLITGAELKWLWGNQPLVLKSLHGGEGSGERSFRMGQLGSKNLWEESVILLGTVRKSPPAAALYRL